MVIPEQHDQNEICKEKFRVLDEHLKESPSRIEMLIRHDTKIGDIESDVFEINKGIDAVKMTIIKSTFVTIGSILVTIIGASIFMGRIFEKVEKLERSHIIVYEDRVTK